MTRQRLASVAMAAALLAASVAPVAAARPSDCPLRLDVPRVNESGDTVGLHVSGLPGIGGIDIFTKWRNVTDEAHLFLVFGITEFDFTYQSYDPEVPTVPLKPGMYRVHAIDANGCEAHASFRVTR